MMTRDRRLLEQLIKQWAQDHTVNFIVADYASGAEGMRNTQGHFTWVIQNESINVDLEDLANRMEDFLESRRKRRHPDGMLCQKCKNFYEFAEPNQEDGSMICYSCRKNPYG